MGLFSEDKEVQRNKTLKDFEESLDGINVPLLVLDGDWHNLFTNSKTPEIKKVEQEIDDLLKRQAYLQEEIKKLKKAKGAAFNNIVEKMDLVTDDGTQRGRDDLDKNQEVIGEINTRIEDYEDELMELPRKISETNKYLMILSMKECYDKYGKNQKFIVELGKWIKETRIQIKKNIIRKQQCEKYNKVMYNYMHNIFGAKVIDIFDMTFIKDEDEAKEAEINKKIDGDK